MTMMKTASVVCLFDHKVLLHDLLNEPATRKEVDNALDSKIVRRWRSARFVENQDLYLAFGVISTLIHEFAKARLGISNRFEPINVFDNSWEVIEAYIGWAKERGLDPQIADKYDFHTGSEDIGRIMADPDAMYSEEEMDRISECLSPAAMNDFKSAIRSLSESKLIEAEERRIKSCNGGDSMTVALAVYDIVMRRLYARHEGDLRLFRKQRTWSRPDGRHGILMENQKATPDMTEGFKWVVKTDVAEDLMHMIAVLPLWRRRIVLLTHYKY